MGACRLDTAALDIDKVEIDNNGHGAPVRLLVLISYCALGTYNGV